MAGSQQGKRVLRVAREAQPYRTAQHGVGGLVERSAHHRVANLADPTSHVGLARLVACRGEAKVRAHVPRPLEPIRPVNGGAEHTVRNAPSSGDEEGVVTQQMDVQTAQDPNHWAVIGE